MKINRKDFIFILCIASLFFIFFGPIIFDVLTFYYRDIFRYYHPVKFFTTESIQNGQIPFWNPYNYCGMPFLAILQHALFYPLNLLCYLLPFDLGFKYFFIIHFLLTGIFIYLLSRYLALDRFSSFISSIVFTFSGYLISTINLVTTLTAVTWVPLIFLFFNIGVEKKKPQYGILTGILLGFQFFSGQPDIVFTTTLMLIGLVIYKSGILLYTEYSHFRQVGKEYYHNVLKMSLVLILSIMCLVLFTAIQSVPFKELINHSTRTSSATFERATFWSLHPLELIGVIIPSFSWVLLAGSEYWLGQSWLRNFYVGILPLVLVFLSLNFKKRESLYFFIMLGIISLILILGKFTLFYSLLFRFIPGLKLIRYPVKFMFLLIFSISILSGMGMHCLIDKIKKNQDLSLLIKGLLTVFLVISVGFIFPYFRQQQIAELFSKYFLKGTLLNEVSMFKARFPRIIRDYFLMLIFFGSNIILFSMISRAKITLNKFKYVYGIFLFLSLAIVSYNIEPIVKIKFYKDIGGNVKFIKNVNKGYGRIFLTPKSEEEVTHTVSYFGYTYYDALLNRKAVILPNTGLPYHIFDTRGYGSMRLRRYNNFMGLVVSRPSPMEAPLINLLNIKYLISLWGIDSSQFKLVQTDYAMIYENKNTLPRVFIIPKAVVINREVDIANKLGGKDFKSLEEVVIEEYPSEVRIQESDKGQTEGRVIITHYDTNEVDIEANLTTPGWLLLTDTYYPGWKVYIDTKKGKIYKADYLFRAVYLDSGRHKVKFVYEPTLFRLAMSLTALAILVFGFIGIYYLIRKETKYAE